MDFKINSSNAFIQHKKGDEKVKNKKKKGFTLIELLAIIVILAIIAVITVPIILNIIENSRKGAATDSAYGYKDAVNEYYMAKSLIDTDYSIPNGEYNIDPQTGYLVGTETLAIQISGLKPTGGSLELEKNKIKQGYLIIGKYKVTFHQNETITVEKNESVPIQPIIILYTDNDESETLTVGDYIDFIDNNGTPNDTSDDISNGFYVMSTLTANGKIGLLAEYNISNAPGFAKSENGPWRQGTQETIGYGEYNFVRFSETDYWMSSAIYQPLYQDDEEVPYVYDSNSSHYTPMENYKDYLETVTGLTLSVRPMSLFEAESVVYDSWAINQAYMLGSYDVQNEYPGRIFCMDECDMYNCGDGHRRIFSMDYFWDSYDGGVGVRPLIEIEPTTVTFQAQQS